MNITLHIEADCPAEMQQALRGLANQITTATSITPEEPAPKRGRKAKETAAKEPEPTEEQPTLDLKEEPVETPADPTPEEPKPETTAAPDAPIPTAVELRAVAAEKGQADPANKPKIKALLDSYASKSISTVPEDKRTAFMTYLEAL